MKKPTLLVACEYSQRVTTAFLKKGFDAYSCDVIDCEGNYPDKHLKMDARKAVKLHDWDLIIAHPPCTYLTVAQCFVAKNNPYKDADRYLKMLDARDFFMFFWNSVSCPLCIENPMPIKLAALPRETQVVSPYMFGSAFAKRTYLWLRDLPPLLPITTKPLSPKSLHDSVSTSKERSRLDLYLAQAMADQWAPLFL